MTKSCYPLRISTVLTAELACHCSLYGTGLLAVMLETKSMGATFAEETMCLV